MARLRSLVLGLFTVCAVASCGAPGDAPLKHPPSVGEGAAPAYTERFIDVGGINTRFLEAGQGDPLLLVHGGGFGDGVSADRWDRNIAELATHFRVFAVDRLGQGFTDNPKREQDYTIDAIVQHLYGFVRAVGLSRIHLVGSSRGAYVVTRLTLDHPELVQTLVLCNSATLAPETGDPGRRAALVVEHAPEDPREAEVYRLTQLSYSADHITDESMDLAMQLIESPKGLEARRMRDGLREQIGREKDETLQRLRSGELGVPTLLAWGYNDRSAIAQNGLALFETIAGGNPDVALYVVNRAGHYVYREQPREFNRIVTEFIAAHRMRS